MSLHGDTDSERAVSFASTLYWINVPLSGAIASIFSPALFPIWCSIGDIILQLSSQRVAVSGDVSLSTGHWTVDRQYICIVSASRALWVLEWPAFSRVVVLTVSFVSAAVTQSLILVASEFHYNTHFSKMTALLHKSICLLLTID